MNSRIMSGRFPPPSVRLIAGLADQAFPGLHYFPHAVPHLLPILVLDERAAKYRSSRAGDELGFKPPANTKSPPAAACSCPVRRTKTV